MFGVEIRIYCVECASRESQEDIFLYAEKVGHNFQQMKAEILGNITEHIETWTTGIQGNSE